MADSKINVPDNGNAGGADTDTEKLAGATHRQRMQLAGALLVEVARVLNGAPGVADYGLLTRTLLFDSAGTPLVLAAGKVPVDVSFPVTQPVSAAALPLPAGASTEATLALIKAKTDNLDAALSTRTKPADQQHVIVDASAAVAVTGPLTDAALRATPVPVSGAVTVSDGSGPLTVDGTVAVSNFPGTQPVSGPLTDAQLRATKVPVATSDGAGNLLESTVNPGTLPGTERALIITPHSLADFFVKQGGAWAVDPDVGTVWDTSDRDPRLLGRVKILDSSGVVVDPATSTSIGLPIASPAAYTVMDRLVQLGKKIDIMAKAASTEATLKKLVPVSKPVSSSYSTLMHR
jgi:hypothetical protein